MVHCGTPVGKQCHVYFSLLFSSFKSFCKEVELHSCPCPAGPHAMLYKCHLLDQGRLLHSVLTERLCEKGWAHTSHKLSRKPLEVLVLHLYWMPNLKLIRHYSKVSITGS